MLTRFRDKKVDRGWLNANSPSMMASLPAAIVEVSGGKQVSTIGTPLEQPLMVQVNNSQGAPVADPESKPERLSNHDNPVAYIRAAAAPPDQSREAVYAPR